MENEDPMYTTREAAKYLGLAPVTLANYRCKSNTANKHYNFTRPTYIRLGRVVLYKKSHLDAYLKSTNKSLPNQEELLTTEQVAKIMGKKPATVVNNRCQGLGVKFIKIGHKVRYRREDLNAYIKECTVQMET